MNFSRIGVYISDGTVCSLECVDRSDSIIDQTEKGKSIKLSIVLSLLIPGSGEIYAGHVDKGIILIALGIVVWFLTFLVIGFFLAVIVIWIYAICDSYILTNYYNWYSEENNSPPW